MSGGVLLLLVLSLGVLHSEGTSWLGLVLAITSAVLAGAQLASESSSIDDHTQHLTDSTCSECGLSKLGRVCCDDHPSVGG